MFERALRKIDDVVRKAAGCTSKLDYTEQIFSHPFLTYLDGLEQDRATEAKLNSGGYAGMDDAAPFAFGSEKFCSQRK